jgi:hypothetical protein
MTPLRGQHFPALGAPALQDVPSVSRFHALAETMLHLALPFLRLKSHFHFSNPFYFSESVTKRTRSHLQYTKCPYISLNGLLMRAFGYTPVFA